MILRSVGQVISPHGFHTRPGPFGQIVIDPGAACRLAMAKGNALAIRLLGSHAAATLLVLAKDANVFEAPVLQTRAAVLLNLVERSAPDKASPTAVWDRGEREKICAEISAAFSESATNVDAQGPRNRLITVAEQIQEALQSPDPGTFKPTPVGPGTGVSKAAIAAIVIAGVLAVGGGAYYFTRRR